MCFTPAISLATAIIEFLVAAYLFKKINKKELRILPYFIILLGLYQLTEFFLCTTDNQIWAKVGFISYTFLPILAAQFFYDLAKKKLNKLFYLIPIAYSLIALFYPGFSITGSCQSFYINTRNLFLFEYPIHLYIYTIYYGLIPLSGAYLYLKYQNPLTNKSTWKLKTSLSLVPVSLALAQAVIILNMLHQNGYVLNWIITSILIIFISLTLIILSFIKIDKRLFNGFLLIVLFTSVLMAYMIYQVFPGFGISFPSIYCQFALLYAIAAVLFVESYQSK